MSRRYMQNGKPVGYMSVRAKPTREQVQAAQALYAKLDVQRGKSHPIVQFARWSRSPHRGGATSWENCSALALRLEWLG